jgi:hypothetical protein
MEKEDLPDFGIIDSDINSDIQLTPAQYFLKPSDTIGILLQIKSAQEIKINCKNNLEIYFKIGQTWKKEYLPCQILDRGNISSIDENIDPNQNRFIIKNLEIVKPTMYPNIPGSLDYRIDSILVVEPEKSESNLEKTTESKSFEITVNPEDSDQEKNIWIDINNRMVHSRRGDLLFLIHAESTDLKTGLSKPIGAYTKVRIME